MRKIIKAINWYWFSKRCDYFLNYLKFKGYVNNLFLINYYLIKKDIKCMTKITKEEVKKVAHLARLELNENEINNHAEQLEKILDYIRQLEKIDTDDVPCTTRAIEVVNVFRKDEKKNSDCNEELLELGPSREDKYFKVPKIINEWLS